MTPNEMKLAARMLREYADRLGNDGCNDMDLTKYIEDPKEAEAMAVELKPADDPEYVPDPRCVYNWGVAGLLANRLEAMAADPAVPLSALRTLSADIKADINKLTDEFLRRSK